MKLQLNYLELVCLSSTVTPAWHTGWAFTATPAPRPCPCPVRPVAAPVRLRLAVVSA